LKDIIAEVLGLTILENSLFGESLAAKLKHRKENNDQLSDLVPEPFDSKKR